MKIKTKLILILAIILAVAGIFVGSHKTLAATTSATSAQDITDCLNTIHFANIAELDCSAGGNTIKFYDRDPTDSDNGPCSGLPGSYCSYNMNYAQQGNFFCETGNVKHSTQVNGERYYYLGVTVQDNGSFKGPLMISDSGTAKTLIFNEGFGAANGQCNYPAGYKPDKLPNATITGARTSNINVLYQFSSDGSSLVPLDAVANSGIPLSDQYSLVGQYTYNNSTVAYVTGYQPGSCNGSVVMVNTTNNRANQYALDNKNQNLSSYPALLDFLNSQGSHGCSLSYAEFGLGGTFIVAGTPPTANTIANAGAAGTSTGSLGSANNCDQSAFSFGWLFCPMLSAIDDTFNHIDQIIQQQLDFNVNQNLTTNVHLAWNTIRDISSVFLIIIMLIMVVSQAFGGGPFDAYTVRKVLPKLVIAVIMAQLSWQVLIWVIGLANDAGKGIADLLFFPFGGSAHMTLDSLVGKLGAGAAGLTAGGGLFAGILVTILNPFGVLLFGFAAIMAVVTAIATLLFRTMLIIGGVVFAPIFFMAWVLPNTQKYWKFWTDNFIKALFLFPIIISMIAIGRIFAWIVGNSNGSHGLFDAIAVLVGYFGPYFLLPKTFKWGGGLMRMANDGIGKAANKIGEGPRNILKKRQEELAHQKQISAAQRLNEWERGRFNTMQKIGSAIRGDKFRSGEWDPTYVGMPPGIGRREMMRQRREKQAKFRAAVPRAEQEEVNDEFDRLKQRTADMTERQRGELVRGIVTGSDGQRHSDATMQAALKQALSDRDYATVENWVNGNVGTAHGREQINLFRNLNAGELSTSVPHLLKGDLDENGLHQGILRSAGSSQQEVAAFHPRAVEAIISHLSAYAADTTRPQASRDSALRELEGFLRTYAAATQNPDVRGSINRGSAEIVRRFVDERENVSDTRDAQGNYVYSSRSGQNNIVSGPNMTVRRALIQNPDFSNVITALAGNIQPGGVVVPSPTAAGEGNVGPAVPGQPAQQAATPAAPGPAPANQRRLLDRFGNPIGGQPGGGPDAGQPGNVQVNIDHDILANAVTQGVRNALQHEVLTVRHEDGGGPAPTPRPNNNGNDEDH